VDAFGTYPANFQKVAQVVGVDRKTAKHAWETGYPGVGRHPIRALVQIEQARRRADMSSAERSAFREQLRDAFESTLSDLVQSRALWGAVARRATANSKASQQVVNVLLHGAVQEGGLLSQIEADMRSGAFTTPQARIKALKTVAQIVKIVNESSAIARDLEDVVLGDADGFASTVESMTDEEAVNEVFEAVAAVRRSARRGIIDADLVEVAERNAAMVVPPETAEEAAIRDAEDLARARAEGADLGGLEGKASQKG
jgi:hypothetical protein